MTPEAYAQQLEKYNFEYFINEALNKVPETIDTRQGSIIYDALAPVAYSYAEISMNLRNLLLSTFTQTAQGEFLDYRGQEKGLTRYAATKAVVSATFVDGQGNPVNVDMGDRFASIGAEPFFYTVSKLDETGKAEMTCETTGSSANHYLGQVLPITPNDELATATIVDVSVPARDDETDDDFRERIMGQSNSVAYGGNIADYQKMVEELGTVGAVQIYPTWNGGGTVKLVIIDNDFDLPSADLISQVQEAIDPTDIRGNGYGLAPIGHTVTVVAPTVRTIPVKLNLEVDATTNLNTAIAAAKEAIAAYFDKVRHNWGDLAVGSRQYALSLYRSQVISAVLNVPGVINVTDLTLEGKDADIQLVFTREKSELPELGEVSISEAATHTAK